jgi:N-formylglutamate amidohydrolase
MLLATKGVWENDQIENNSKYDQNHDVEPVHHPYDDLLHHLLEITSSESGNYMFVCICMCVYMCMQVYMYKYTCIYKYTLHHPYDDLLHHLLEITSSESGMYIHMYMYVYLCV